MNEVITVRDIDTVTTEIKMIQSQTQRVCMLSAIQIGGRLVEAKEMLPHGEWGAWLAKSVKYSQSTADNLIRLYKEYGDKDQDSLFENSGKSQAFANLSYTQALALLAVPADEREQFATENDVAEMSTRELQQAIKERNAAIDAKDAAIAERDAAKQDREAAEEETEALKKTLESYGAITDRVTVLEKEKADASAAADKARKKVEKLQKQLEEAKTGAAAATAQLEKARAHPEIPASIMDQMRAEVTEQAAKDAAADLQKQLDAATADLKKQRDEAERKAAAAELAKTEAEAKAAAAQQQAKIQTPEVAAFGAMFEALQEQMIRINAHRAKTMQTNPEAAAGMLRALKAVYAKAQESLEDAE